MSLSLLIISQNAFGKDIYLLSWIVVYIWEFHTIYFPKLL